MTLLRQIPPNFTWALALLMLFLPWHLAGAESPAAERCASHESCEDGAGPENPEAPLLAGADDCSGCATKDSGCCPDPCSADCELSCCGGPAFFNAIQTARTPQSRWRPNGGADTVLPNHPSDFFRPPRP